MKKSHLPEIDSHANSDDRVYRNGRSQLLLQVKGDPNQGSSASFDLGISPR